jgi:hypothetical protein
MVSDMITHHESVMKDRLSGKSHPVSQEHRGMGQYENAVVEDQADRTKHQNQVKNITKEVRESPPAPPWPPCVAIG